MNIQINMDDVQVVMREDENVRLKLTNQALRRMLETSEVQNVTANMATEPANGRVGSGDSAISRDPDTPA